MSEELSLTLRDDLLTSIEKFEEISKNVVIMSADARSTADGNLKLANNLKKAIVADLAEQKSEYHKKWKAVGAFEKKYTDVVDRCVGALKKAIMSFDEEERKRAEVERKRLQAIADEKARKEKERLEKQAAKLKTPERKEALLEQAAMVESAEVQIAEPEKEKGSSYTKTTYKAEVVDFILLPNDWKMPNQKALDKFANDATEAAKQIPGVKIKEVQTLVSGRS